MKKTKSEKTKSDRHLLMGLIEKASRQLGWDKDFRLERQKDFCGKSSRSEMTDGELSTFCWHLKRLGANIYVPQAKAKGGQTATRPTTQQLSTIEQLATQQGWHEGLDDVRLQAFSKRTTGVDNVRFLTRYQATQVITGLRRWSQQQV